MAQQLENERRLIGEASTKTLLKEMWLVPGNRKRAIISIFLMIWQQMTGVNAIVSHEPRLGQPLSILTNILEELLRPSDLQRPWHDWNLSATLRHWRLWHRQSGRMLCVPGVRR